jgi:thiamine-phosphate pyrophosphorylase
MTATDLVNRARFYAILDTTYAPAARWQELCRELVIGGADLIQLRAKRESSAERHRLLQAALEVTDALGFPRAAFIVNDDLELCLATDGVGLHVGQDDTPPEQARAALGPDRMIGLSTHSLEQAQAALALPSGTLSYFAVGPVFATQTKPEAGAVGLELVRAVAALRPALPFFCIGGINRRTAAQAIGAGATRLCAVSDVLCAEDPAAVARELASLARAED